MLTKNDWHENVRELVVNHVKGHDRSGRPDQKRDYELKRGPTGRRSSNARQLGCVFQDMKPPKSGRAHIIHNSHFKRRISLEEQKALKQERLPDL